MDVTHEKLMKADLLLSNIRELADSLTLVADGLEFRYGRDSGEGPGVHRLAETIKEKVRAVQELLLM